MLTCSNSGTWMRVQIWVLDTASIILRKTIQILQEKCFLFINAHPLKAVPKFWVRKAFIFGGKKSILHLHSSFAAPQIGIHYSYTGQASLRGSKSDTHIFWWQVWLPSSFYPGPKKLSDLGKIQARASLRPLSFSSALLSPNNVLKIVLHFQIFTDLPSVN